MLQCLERSLGPNIQVGELLRGIQLNIRVCQKYSSRFRLTWVLIRAIGGWRNPDGFAPSSKEVGIDDMEGRASG